MGLKSNKNLKILNLRDNNFVLKGALDLLDVLNFNKSLARIILSKNQIKSELKEQILEKVERNKTKKNSREITSIKREAKKLKRTRKFPGEHLVYENELLEIIEEKEKKMGDILGHGDKLTEMMDDDRLKNWNIKKVLKKYEEETS